MGFRFEDETKYKTETLITKFFMGFMNLIRDIMKKNNESNFYFVLVLTKRKHK